MIGRCIIERLGSSALVWDGPLADVAIRVLCVTRSTDETKRDYNSMIYSEEKLVHSQKMFWDTAEGLQEHRDKRRFKQQTEVWPNTS